MNNSDYKWIEDKLAPPPPPEPPEDLLGAIQREIPDYLSVVPEPAEKKRSFQGFRLIAASLLVVAFGGTVAYQVLKTGPRLEAPPLAESVLESPNTEVPTLLESLEDTPARQQDTPSDRLDRVPESRPVESEPEAPVSVPERRSNEVEAGAEELLMVAEPKARQDLLLADSAAPAPEAAEPQERDSRDQGLATRAGSGRARKESAPGLEYAAPQRSTLEGPAMRVEAPGMVIPAQPPSTGGTAEPNDAPYGDMFFRSYGTNPFVDTEDDNLSTFGLDVDTGSFTMARSYLDRGHQPPPEAIRVEEFVNYFDYGDPAPRRGEFTLVAEGAPSPFAQGPRYHLVRFGIQARELRSGQRRPAVLIFVVDVSGSMRRENRLDLVKRSLELLLDELESEDEIGLVVYGGRGEVLLEPTRNKEAIRRAIERLTPGGSTNAEEGLDLAYGLARRYEREGAIHRIILCSDGVANVGRTGPESILERVRGAAGDGIELTTVGFGMGNYNDVLMEQLANQGDGSYAYVDSLAEARRIFVENLTGTLQTIAADAKVQVEFNPETVSRYRLLGYENRDIADERFRDDTVDAGEIGAGHAVTALYEIKLAEGVRRKERLATLSLRYRSKASGRIVETSIDLDRRHLASSWERASTALKLSSLAAEFAEILKGSYWAKGASLDDLYRRLRPVADELSDDQEVEDLLYLVDRARRLPTARHDWQGEE